MLTPSQLSSNPNVIPVVAPEYNFSGQNRWDGTMMAGSYTGSSIQTFASNGQPCDSQSDSND